MAGLRRVVGGPLGAGLRTAFICLVVALLMFGSQGLAGLDQASTWLLFGVFGVSLAFLWGYCGLVTMGHAVFFGIGAYAYAWLTTDRIGANLHSVGSILGPFFAMIVAGLLALSLGYFLFYGRIVGAFFSIVTLAVSFMMESLARFWTPVLGGQTGIPDVPPISIEFWSMNATTRGVVSGFVLAAVVAVIVVIALEWVVTSSFGLLMDGVRDNEERFIHLGAETHKIKLVVFVISAVVAGLAGSLYAAEARFVSSDLLGTLLSIEAVIWVAVGGRKSLVGALLGTLIVRGVGSWLSDLFVNYWLICLGALFIVIVLAGSTGLAGLGGWAAARAKRLWMARNGDRLAAEKGGGNATRGE